MTRYMSKTVSGWGRYDAVYVQDCEFSLHKLTANLQADVIQVQTSSITVLNVTAVRSGVTRVIGETLPP
jgi:hypothetical protein